MALLIDTSIFIAIERRHLSDLRSALVSVGTHEAPVLSSITASELLIGVHRADTPTRRTRREAFVEGVLAAFPILPVDVEVARTHARLWAQLAMVGQAIGDRDLLIAATALTYGHAILTDNRRDFTRVPGLVVHQPLWP